MLEIKEEWNRSSNGELKCFQEEFAEKSQEEMLRSAQSQRSLQEGSTSDPYSLARPQKEVPAEPVAWTQDKSSF